MKTECFWQIVHTLKYDLKHYWRIIIVATKFSWFSLEYGRCYKSASTLWSTYILIVTRYTVIKLNTTLEQAPHLGGGLKSINVVAIN